MYKLNPDPRFFRIHVPTCFITCNNFFPFIYQTIEQIYNIKIKINNFLGNIKLWFPHHRFPLPRPSQPY